MKTTWKQLTQAGAFRLWLATMVIVDHATRFDLGGIAVQAFFILSGYWVSAMWLGKYSSSNKPLATFYISRFLRIWPLYAFIVILTLIATATLDPGHIPSTVSLQNFSLIGIANTDADLLGVSWSLDIEAQFYIIAPFLTALLIYIKPKPIQTLTAFCILSIAGLALSQYLQIHTIFLYIPSFLIGNIIATTRKPQNKPTNPTTAAISFFTFLLAAFAYAYLALRQPQITHGLIPRTLIELIVASTAIPYINYTLNKRSNTLDRTIGNIAFPLYLIHYPILHLSFVNLAYPSHITKSLAIAIAYTLAFILTISVDAFFEKLRKLIIRQLEVRSEHIPTPQQ